MEIDPEIREHLALEVEKLMLDQNGKHLPSVFALMWIMKCANRVRGIA